MERQMSNAIADEAERSIEITRLFDAPRALVFAAFTDPLRLPMWWGPRGYSCETHSMDLRVGGAWRFTMHGPGGVTYPNRLRYRAIEPASRIEMLVDSDRDDDPQAFLSFITFTDEGVGTRVTMRTVFPTAEHRAAVVAFGAIELGRTTLDKCAENIVNVRVRGANVFTIPPGETWLTIERELDAPRTLVWEAVTRAEHMRHWYGPRGSTVSVCSMELRVGGAWRCVIEHHGAAHGFGGVFQEIVPPVKLVQTWRYDGFPDAESVETLELFELPGGRTRIVGTTRHLTVAHRDGHVASGMEQGAAETWDRLAERVAQLQRV